VDIGEVLMGNWGWIRGMQREILVNTGRRGIGGDLGMFLMHLIQGKLVLRKRKEWVALPIAVLVVIIGLVGVTMAVGLIGIGEIPSLMFMI
jgi:hypothetical protein